MTGVPQAIASTITIPNGSAHRIGINSAFAWAVQLALAVIADLADVADRVPVDVRLDLAGEELLLARVYRAGQDERQVRRARHRDGALRPLVVVHARDPQQVVACVLSERPFLDGEWIVHHRDVVTQVLGRGVALGAR